MKLGDWLDSARLFERLLAKGMRSTCAQRCGPHFAESATALLNAGVAVESDVIACWVPGRIEVLGKHTDYCGGESLLAAAERGFCMIAVARGDQTIVIHDARQQEGVEFPIDAELAPKLGHWSNYPRTVVRRIVRNFPHVHRGATIAFSSNLPPSSGMSSSSALIVGTFVLISGVCRLTRDDNFVRLISSPTDWAGYLSTVENGMSFGTFEGDRGVGTEGGSEDHTAILCSQPGKIVKYGFCPVRYRGSIEIADDYIFSVASSGVVADKTGGAMVKYNRLSALAAAIVAQWQRHTGGSEATLAAILASGPDTLDRLEWLLTAHSDSEFPPHELCDRLKQFVIESELIRAIPQCLRSTTMDHFGGLVKKSQTAAASLLKNQTAETVRLVEIARQLGACAATSFGAGFGGSVWALIERDGATAFRDQWHSRYCAEFPNAAKRAKFFFTRPGMAMQVWQS